MYLLLTQFLYSLKSVWMDKKPILFRLGVFVLMTFILGSAFNSSFSKNDIDPVKIGYYSQDVGDGGQEYFTQLTSIQGFEGIATFTKLESFEAGQQKVEDGELGAMLYIGKDFSDNLAADNGRGTVEVYMKKYSGINYPVVSSVVDSFNSGANTAWAVKSIGTAGGDTSSGSVGTSQGVELHDVTSSRNLTGFSYYAVGMLLFLLLYGTEYGSFGGMHEDFLGVVGKRTRLTLVKPWQQYLGKLLAFSLVPFTQGAIYIGVTSQFFGVDWGQNLPLTLAFVYIFGVLAIALGMTVMTMTRSERKTKGLLQVAILGSTFLAGGFVVAKFGPLELISPSYYAREGLFGLMFGETTRNAINYLGVLGAITVVLAALSMVSARRRLA
jgi:putative permease